MKTSKEFAEALFVAKGKFKSEHNLKLDYSEIKLYNMEEDKITFMYNDTVVFVEIGGDITMELKKIKKIQPESFEIGAHFGGMFLAGISLIDAVITNDPFSAGLMLLGGAGVFLSLKVKAKDLRGHTSVRETVEEITTIVKGGK